MTPAGTSNELDVQNGWEENTHTHTQYRFGSLLILVLYSIFGLRVPDYGKVIFFRDIKLKMGLGVVISKKVYRS